MPQPKKSSGSGRSGGGARSGSGASRKGTSARARSAATSPKRKTASRATKASSAGAKRTSRGSGSRSSGSGSGASRAGSRSTAPSGATQSAGSLRELLVGSVLGPLNLVVLTSERLQETFDDAVQRGRVTRDDAEELLSDLMRRSRKQTEDVLNDIEEAVAKQVDQLETATGAARKQAADARRLTRDSVRKAVVPDRVLREVDRARRVTGLGPTFPIMGYDELAAGQVIDRLADLSAAQLRKVRDHERRNANRKSVLNAVERKLD